MVRILQPIRETVSPYLFYLDADMMSHLKASYPVLSSIPRVIIVSNNRYIYTETHVLTIRARLASVYIASVARRSIHQLVHTLDITSNSPA